VLDGIRTQISTAYKITNVERVGMEDGKDMLRLKWMPVEISVVSIAADDSIGVGRSDPEVSDIDEKIEITQKEEKRKMENVDVIKETLSAERQRASDITELGKRYGMEKEAHQYMTAGKPVEEFRKLILDKIAEKQEATRVQAENMINLDMTPKDAKRYDLGKAIMNKLTGRFAGTFEDEVSVELGKRSNSIAKGFYLPWELMSRTANPTTWTTEATDLVKTSLMVNNFIDILRAKLVFDKLGVDRIVGLTGNVDIPRLTQGITPEVPVTENTALVGIQASYDKISLNPHDLGAMSLISKKLINQSGVDISGRIQEDIAKQFAGKLEYYALYGSDSDGQCKGLSEYSINSYSGSAAPTFANVVRMETEIELDNADEANMCYLSSPNVKGSLKTTNTATNSGIMIWQNNEVNGYKAFSTSNLATNTLLFADWFQMVLAIFGPGIDITLDALSLAEKNIVRIIAYTQYDIGVKQANAFCKLTGISVS
jgi:HK97 family phage major capsid protein